MSGYHDKCLCYKLQISYLSKQGLDLCKNNITTFVRIQKKLLRSYDAMSMDETPSN